MTMSAWPIQVKEKSLDNGLRCVAVEVPHVHSATAILFVRAGSRYETPETNGISHLLEHMIFRGTPRFENSYPLASAVESFGASFNAETSRDAASYYIDTVPRHFFEALDLLAEMFRGPRFADLDVEREIVLEEMSEDYNEEGLLTDMDSLTRPRIWPDHPMGLPVIGVRENIERFSVDDLRTFWDAHYQANNMVLCAAGAVDADSFFAGAADAFSFLKTGTAYEPEAPVPAPGGSRAYVPNPDSQLSVNLAWPALAESDPKYVVLGMLRRILDDGLSSRLHRRIVDADGLAYSIEAHVEGYSDAGLFEIEAELAPHKLEALARALREMVDELRSELPTEAELERVKERARCDVELVQDNVTYLAEWQAGTRLYRTPKTLDEVLTAIDSVTAEAIRDMAVQVLDAHRLHVTVVGPRKHASRLAVFG